MNYLVNYSSTNLLVSQTDLYVTITRTFLPLFSYPKDKLIFKIPMRKSDKIFVH